MAHTCHLFLSAHLQTSPERHTTDFLVSTIDTLEGGPIKGWFDVIFGLFSYGSVFEESTVLPGWATLFSKRLGAHIYGINEVSRGAMFC